MASRVINFASGSYAAADRPPAKLAHNPPRGVNVKNSRILVQSCGTRLIN